MKKLYEMIKKNDEAVFALLEKQNLKPEYFAFRWITLLLSQDFKLPGNPFLHFLLILKCHVFVSFKDIITLWDCLFCDRNPFEFLLHVCCGMIL